MVMDVDKARMDSGNFVKSLARGLAVIRSFDADNPTLTLAQVARRAQIPPAAARRFLRTLETLGYVRSDDRAFALTPKVLELGHSYLSALSLPELMQPHLERLSAKVGESVSAAVLAGADIIYIARVPTQRIMTVAITIGTRFPAAVTSMGRVLLSDWADDDVVALLEESPVEQFTDKTTTHHEDLLKVLAQARQEGWVMVEGELESGLRSIAAPIRDKTGQIVAAINVSASTSQRPREETLDHHLPLLLDTAEAINAELRLQ